MTIEQVIRVVFDDNAYTRNVVAAAPGDRPLQTNVRERCAGRPGAGTNSPRLSLVGARCTKTLARRRLLQSSPWGALRWF